MKKLSINLLTNVLMLLVGVCLILFYNVPDLMVWVAIVLGLLFLLPAMSYLIVVAVRHAGNRSGTDYLGMLPALGGVCFGIIMLLRPSKFCEVLQLLMGVLLVVLGLYHIIYLALSQRTLKVKGWYYLAPVVVVLCGVLSLTWLHDKDQTVVLLTGICLLLFNFTSLQEYLAERRARRVLAKNSASSPDSASVPKQPVEDKDDKIDSVDDEPQTIDNEGIE